jgi:glycosyltransferase involved in cell wall biosynthesis
MKIGIISVALPPSQSGQSIVLFNLLKRWIPDTYFLITQKNFHVNYFQGNCSEKLQGKYFFLHPDFMILQRILKGLISLHQERFFEVILKFRIWQIKKVLIHEACDQVVACTGDIFDPPAAFYASKKLGIPFVLYTFDYYSKQWVQPHYRSFAERYEKDILLGAFQVIVPNECMEKEYRERYGIHSLVIHNPVELEEYIKNEGIVDRNLSPGPKIVYTGAIYDANFKAFHNLLAAIEKTKIPNLNLHVYTPQSVNYLKKNGIEGQVEYHNHLPNNRMPAVQRNANILFLPLAFNSRYPDIIKTSAPGKIGEYLASRRPILVHAPSDSFVAWYFRKYSCGYVVDQDDPEALAEAIIHLLQDKKLQQELSDNAYVRAKEDFDITLAQKKFQDLLKG